jgi:class 3 adenylate cyclase/tetratricopeptide (TPR) repeat protein
MAIWACSACGGENPEGMNFCGHCGAQASTASATTEADASQALRSFVSTSVADRIVESGGELGEERRLITALFADVSGFTSLAERLDPEELLEVIDPVISALSSVVGRYEGYVEKFAGDALLALFGAPVTHEDDATRALLVALEMHEELARLTRELPHDAELTLHVGINSGHGIARILGSEARMDYGVLGDSVILAQRLESAAPPGETYVSETTLALTRGEFEFEPVGELTLKGKAEPVPAWRLVGEREDKARLARPSLIGREAELAVVEGALADLRARRGCVLAITGEPGIGKSRLTEAAFERAMMLGARVLHARCLSYGAELPYWPYLDLVRRAAGLRSDEKPHETRARLGAALLADGAPEAAPVFARLLGLPVDAEDISGLEPEAFRRRLHEMFATWLRALAQRSPVVLALEDVHWSDASSLELTASLTRVTQESALLLVLVGRPEAREAISLAAGDVELSLIELGPLESEGIGHLASAILGGPAPEILSIFIERRTSGNPFFVQELVRTLRDSSALELTDTGWTIRPGWDARQLPPTIEGVLAARIDLLPRNAAALLQTASVIGRRTRMSLLQAVADDPDLESPVRELVARGLLNRAKEDGEPVVVFHHALVQDAAYSRLLRRRRRELHLRVAEVAEALYGSGEHVIDLLARHLYLGGSPKAPAYLVRAGERAKRLYANEEAILHFKRALELAPTDTETALGLADVHELVGDYDEALHLYGQVRHETHDVRAWRGEVIALRRRGNYMDALATIDAAFADPALKEQDVVPLWLEAGWTLATIGRGDQAADILHAAIEASDGRPDVTLAQLLVQLARVEAILGRYEKALEHGVNAERVAEESGDIRTLVSALRVLGNVYWHLTRLDDARAVALRGLELAERVGNSEEIGACLVVLGLVEKDARSYEAALAYTRRAIDEFERAGSEGSRAQAYTNLAWFLEEADQLDESLEVCSAAEDLAKSIGYPIARAQIADTRALVELKRENFVGAAIKAEEAARLYVEFGTIPDALSMLELAADAWRRGGEVGRARECDSRARGLTVA